MEKIPLTKGMTAKVDDIDYDYLTDLGSWCFSNASYAVIYLRRDDGRRTTRSMHRLVMARKLGHSIPHDLVVDHISAPRVGILARLDNRRSNLRLASRSENQANKGVQVNTPFGLRGVTLQGSKYRARIKYDCGHQLHLGMYSDPELAARVYDAAGRLLNQEYAGLNFPDEETTPPVMAILRRYLERNAHVIDYLHQIGQGRVLDDGA